MTEAQILARMEELREMLKVEFKDEYAKEFIELRRRLQIRKKT